MSTAHKIPLGALVEVTYQDSDPDQDRFGIRLFVVQHSKDCDGTPLYGLSFDKMADYEMNDASKFLDERKHADANSMEMQLVRMNFHSSRGSIDSGYTEENLKVISLPA